MVAEPSFANTIGSEALTPEELQLWLEWSGSKLLAMNIRSPFPKEPNSAWPEFASDATLAYGYSGERLRPAHPSSFEIELMDKLLALPSFIKDVNARKIVNARAMVAPISNRYLYSWSKIAFMLHTDKRLVRRLHHRGLCEIVSHLQQEKIYAIRLLLSTFTT